MRNGDTYRCLAPPEELAADAADLPVLAGLANQRGVLGHVTGCRALVGHLGREVEHGRGLGGVHRGARPEHRHDVLIQG